MRAAWLMVAIGGCQALAQLDERRLGPATEAGADASADGAGGSGGDADAAPDVAAGAGGSGASDASTDAPAGCPPPTAGSSWPDSTPYCADGSLPPCAIPGQDGDHFDAPPNLIDQGEVVADDVTGLLWEKIPTGTSLPHADAQAHCGGLSASAFGGATDWRLPTLMELTSIVDYGKTAPMTGLPLGAASSKFWTSESIWVAGDAQLVMVFDFGTGLTAPDIATLPRAARCVSGGPVPGGIVTADAACPGVLADTRTGLEWQKTSAAPHADWESALGYCATLKELGGGWRLPSVKELVTLIKLPTADDQQSTLPPDFEGESGADYWSATPEPAITGRAYYVSFGVGHALEGVFVENVMLKKRFRCVRP